MGTINRVLVCILSGAAVFGVFAAAPTLVDGSVTLTQDPLSQQVTVSYELENAPAVVTVDFLTNGVSIGSRNIGALAGDVNKVVSPGVNTLYWHPAKSWPNRTVGGEGLCAKVTLWPTNAPPDYMVIDLTLGPSDTSIPVSERIRYYTCAEAVDLPGGIEGDLCKTDYLVLRKIHAAGKTFCMSFFNIGNHVRDRNCTPSIDAAFMTVNTFELDGLAVGAVEEVVLLENREILADGNLRYVEQRRELRNAHLALGLELASDEFVSFVYVHFDGFMFWW